MGWLVVNVVLLGLAVQLLAAPGRQALNPRRKFEVHDKASDPHVGAFLGTTFAFAFLNSHEDFNDNSYTENLTLIINNPDPTRIAQVSLSSSFLQFTGSVIQVQPASSSRFSVLPVTIQTQYGNPTPGQFTTETKAIFATSNLPITIIASNVRSTGGSGDQFYVIPTCQTGTDYMMVADEAPVGSTRIVSVVIQQDGTDVLFQNGSRQWATYSNLQRGQVVSYTSREYYLSGAYVHSTRPTTVISGTVCGFGWIQSGGCSHMISANGVVLGTVNAQQWVRVYWDNEYFVASRPVQVVQVGGVVNANFGAPFLVDVPALPIHMLVTGVVQFSTDYDTFTQASIMNYVRIIVPNENLGQVSIDTFAPDELAYTAIGVNSGYSYFDQNITPGTHTVSGPGAKFAVIVYGYGTNLGYGYVAGMELPCLSLDKTIIAKMNQAVAQLGA